eukprot:365821-Chlamydomonas_euryale.AAC.8
MTCEDVPTRDVGLTLCAPKLRAGAEGGLFHDPRSRLARILHRFRTDKSKERKTTYLLDLMCMILHKLAQRRDLDTGRWWCVCTAMFGRARNSLDMPLMAIDARMDIRACDQNLNNINMLTAHVTNGRRWCKKCQHRDTEIRVPASESECRAGTIRIQ